MFKHISISLEGPICKCDQQNLAWGIYRDDKNQSCIYIRCDTCKTELRVPHDRFIAYFTLEKEYPEEKGIMLNPQITKEDKEFLKGIDMKPE